MLGLVRRFFGTASDRYIKRLRPTLQTINALGNQVESLSDEDLKARTGWLKDRLAKGESLDALLPDAFATVREAARRVLGLYPYDVQLVGGIVLHRGGISEMRTGEGKTLAATLPVYLNALTGKGVHVITVNDYLVKRDAEWMGRIYEFLGLSVGFIVHGLTDSQRRQAYQADITYGTNSEFGFDYLRDNMKLTRDEMILRPFNYAIVDEVDSILIDEARTPLIISGPAEESSDLYLTVDALIKTIKPEHYEKDEKSRSAHLSEDGMVYVEEACREKGLLKGQTLYDDVNITLVHHINQALKANVIFAKDVDYIVRSGKVMLVDEFTGRIMDGRRYSDGLHQALEAKEGVTVEIENQTLASVTYQNFFRLYPKLAGMTGTALTDAEEFHSIYKLNVVSIPTNKPIQRQDKDDEVYRTFQEKSDAVLALVKEVHAKGQPILLGTVSIEKSELFSAFLTKHKIPHKVLNARHHQQEAEIIAEAGAPGAITIATNMAGRGTDIKLGGNLDMRLEKALEGTEDAAKRQEITKKLTETFEKDKAKVLEAGGLFIIGTERHESRRIDNQLRGRSGRQGDPGASKFFLSLQDDLMRIFGSEKLDEWLVKLGLKEGEAITHPWVNRALEKAQQRVEARNFDTRKHLLKYDDVMNEQRKVVYRWRLDLIDHPTIGLETMENEIHQTALNLVEAHAPQGTYPDEWTMDALEEVVVRLTGEKDVSKLRNNTTHEALEADLKGRLQKAFDAKASSFGAESWQQVCYQTLLQQIDQGWKDHLYALDHVRQGVHLRSYAQKDPFNEYATEAFRLFESFLSTTTQVSLETLLGMPAADELQSLLKDLAKRTSVSDDMMVHEKAPGIADGAEDLPPESLADEALSGPQVIGGGEEASAPPSRNGPCPCGSGKRYKNCHGKL